MICRSQRFSIHVSTVVAPGRVGKRGRIYDRATGQPFHGTCRLSFAVYDHSADALPIWSETYADVICHDGHFAVLLETVSLATWMIFAESGRVLGITVGPDSEALPLPMVGNFEFDLVADEAAALRAA